MVRRRHTYLLALSLVSFGLLYITVTHKIRVVSNSQHPEFVAKNLPISSSLVNAVPQKILSKESQNCSTGSLMYGGYCVISPYDDEVKHTVRQGPVTLCTQGTVEFLQHVPVLCHRWSAPISVAVYAPAEDYADSIRLVRTLRRCDACVRYWVAWHFFFPDSNDPILTGDPPTPDGDCIAVTLPRKPAKRKSRGTYPINVGRNIARSLAGTPYVFSTDIELYPSLDIPARFERMLHQSGTLPDRNQVWVLPVFEVHSKYRAPLLKSDLKNMYNKRQVISFHMYRCNICHRIPNLTQWIAHGAGTTSEVEDSLEPLRVWTTVKRSRHYKLHEWEPFFIGTTKDPEFDVRLSWEGKQNKMQMAFEMCMRDYDFHIVENAFLVHSPGINIFNATKEKEREKHFGHNRRVVYSVRKELIQKYGKKDC